MRLLIGLGMTLLTGCAAVVTAEPFKAPDGRAAYLIDCNDNIHSMAQCYDEANRVCPAGYDLLSRNEVGEGPRRVRNIEIACKG